VIESVPLQPATLLLIAVNVVISLRAFSRRIGGHVTEEFLFVPAEVDRGRNLAGMLLSQCAHADAAHLLFNMLTLLIFGPVVEEQLGPSRLLLIYGLSALGATLLTFVVHRNDPAYRALGASGAVTGVLFAAIVLAPGMDIGLFVLRDLYVPAPVFAIAYVLASIWAARRRLGNIGHEAHIGGAVTGLLFAGQLSADGFRPLLERLRDLLERLGGLLG
jgi:membrane associated rhomboid family serine protease